MSRSSVSGRSRPVLHLIDSLECGGAQQMLVELAKGVPRESHPAVVAVIQPRDDLAGRLEELGVTVHRFGRSRVSITHPLGFLRYMLGTLLDVYRLCRRERVAVLHCHLADAEFIGILAGRLARVPVVVDTVHTPHFLPSRHRLDPRGWLRLRLIPLVLNLADRVVAVSEETGEALRALGVDPEKLRVVENGVAVDEHPAPPDSALRASLGLEPGDPVLVAVGRLVALKGHAHLLRALPVVLKRHPRARLLLVGEGEERRALEELARAEDVSDHVILLGLRSDIRGILALADVFVMPSLFEGTSLALLEAMAEGRAIVATDIKGNRSVLRHDSNSLLVPPSDPQALGRAISRLLSEPELSGRLGSQARLDLVAGHSLAAMCAAYEALWAGAAQPSRSGHSAHSTESGQSGHSGQSGQDPADGNTVVDRPVRVAVMGLRGIPATWGGVEHQCEQLYSRLATMGFEVTVYARKGYVDPAVTCHRSVRVVCLPTVGTKHLEALVHTFLAVLHAGFSPYDIWHIYSQGPFLCSPLARLLRPRRPLFFTCGGLDWRRRKWSLFASGMIALGEKLSARLADTVVVVSRGLGDYYRKRYGVEAAYIANGVDIPEPTPFDRVRIPDLKPGGYFLFVGRLVPEKRVEDLMQAMKLVPGETRLVIAGGAAAAGDYEARLNRLAGEDPRVVLAGYRYGEELAALYSNALAYVTASELEGLPLTLLEAMSHGLPCLASDIPPHREVLESLEGDLLPVHDVKAMAKAMLDLAALPDDRRQAWGETCREHVREHYGWDQAAGLLSRSYRQSLARPS